MTLQQAVASQVPRVGHPEFDPTTYVELDQFTDGVITMVSDANTRTPFQVAQLSDGFYFSSDQWYEWSEAR